MRTKVGDRVKAAFNGFKGLDGKLTPAELSSTSWLVCKVNKDKTITCKSANICHGLPFDLDSWIIVNDQSGL